MVPPGPLVDGAVLEAPAKERRYPELFGRHGRARLVIFGAEVGGMETAHFLLHRPWPTLARFGQAYFGHDLLWP